MTTTKPSTKSLHRVILNNKDRNFCILEVKRKDQYFIYELDKIGNATLVSNSSIFYTMGKDERDEIYFLDYLPASVLQKIDILTENPNLDKIFYKLLEFKQEISEPDYDFASFNMEQAYLLEDYSQWVGQMREFTQDDEYAQKLIFLEKFFDDTFFNRSTHFSVNEQERIVKILEQEIAWIKTHQNQ